MNICTLFYPLNQQIKRWAPGTVFCSVPLRIRVGTPCRGPGLLNWALSGIVRVVTLVIATVTILGSYASWSSGLWSHFLSNPSSCLINTQWFSFWRWPSGIYSAWTSHCFLVEIQGGYSCIRPHTILCKWGTEEADFHACKQRPAMWLYSMWLYSRNIAQGPALPHCHHGQQKTFRVSITDPISHL